MPVLSQESERSCSCIKGVSMLPLSTILELYLFIFILILLHVRITHNLLNEWYINIKYNNAQLVNVINDGFQSSRMTTPLRPVKNETL
jgi:hypothetical protein